jgi:hypothetical protein
MRSSVSEVCFDYELKDLVKEQEVSLTGEHYVVVCPKCAQRHLMEGQPNYKKRKLYITKKLDTSYCFVCNTVFLNKSDKDRKKNEIGKLYEEHEVNLKHNTEFSPIPYRFSSTKDEESIKYLLGRSKYYNIDELINDGFYPEKDKVIINYLYHGNKYFYQIRYIHPKDGRKYYIPPTDFKPLYFAKGEFSTFKPTILVEGAFSSYCLKLVVPEYNVVAVQGKTITDKQIEMLQDVGGILTPTFLFMDESEISFNVLKALKRNRAFGRLRVIKNDFGKDPEELSGYFNSKDEYRKYILDNTKEFVCM